MGKPYLEELGMLPATHDWAVRERPSGLERFINAALSLPLCAVGSGGSLAAAAFAAMLHRRTLNPARYATPWTFSWEPPARKCATLLVSAGGRNPEILGALQTATRPIGVVCASGANPLVESAPPGTHVHAVEPPTGRDGFLATNTLLATCVWLAMAYGRHVPFLREYDLTWAGLTGPCAEDMVGAAADEIVGRKHLLVLADPWSWPAAVDAESRFHESGLAAVQITDWRNFAHGRHNWLAVHGDETGVVALATPHSDRLADRTLALLPSDIPVARLDSLYNRTAGSLNLLVKVMQLVGELGAIRGIDPGMPEVAEFGRRIHHMDDPAPDP